MTLKTRIAELRALCEKATAGPWFAVVNDLIGGTCVRNVDKTPAEEMSGDIADMLRTEADAAFIAKARTALPQALDALEVYDETLRSNLVTLEAAKAKMPFGIGHENIVSRLNAQIALTRQALAQAAEKMDG